MVVRERMKNLGITYKNFSDILFLPNNVMDDLLQYFYATGDYEGDNYIYGHLHHRAGGGLYDYIWDETLHLIDRYKKNVFDIPLDTEYISPIVPAISKTARAAIKALILAPALCISSTAFIFLRPFA